MFQHDSGMPGEISTKFGTHMTIYIFILYYKNSVASVRKRTIPTERPLLVSEDSVNFLRIEGATW
jgi:hypothetical protein